MGIRWDWLQPVMTAPYVPTLGPAHPEAVTPGLFADVNEIAGTDRFLPHDKDRRWAHRKDEQVLTDAITQEPGLVLIPTLSTRRHCVKVHIYSQHPRGALSQAADLGRWLCEEHAAENRRLIWFLPPGSDPDPVATCTRIQMRTFDPGNPALALQPGVVPLDEVTGSARATFSAFSQKLAAEGFAFLEARIREPAPARCSPASGTARSSGRSARWRPCRTAAEPPGCCRSISASCPSIAGSALAVASGGPPCTGDSSTRPPTSFCKRRPAAHPTACAGPKGYAPEVRRTAESAPQYGAGGRGNYHNSVVPRQMLSGHDGHIRLG